MTAQSESEHHHHHDGACCHGHHGVRAEAPFDGEALVSARGLTIVRGGLPLLQHVDIDIKPGEIVTVIGPNGAGKTTLVRALLGLEKPDEGGIRRRAGLTIGYVPQRFDIDRTIPMTVGRFLALGHSNGADTIKKALEDTGAAYAMDRQMVQLSGGELQRVLLARALLRDPRLLVLDEPVRGVDYTGEAEMYALIGRLRDARGFGVLLVSHDLHVVMAASDRVICLNRHVCCSGVPETVSQHPEYVRLFGPEAARAIGLYRHHHDHSHDISGLPAAGPSPSREGGRA
jgi:zinc transport system ATP-binding protein